MRRHARTYKPKRTYIHVSIAGETYICASVCVWERREYVGKDAYLHFHTYVYMHLHINVCICYAHIHMSFTSIAALPRSRRQISPPMPVDSPASIEYTSGKTNSWLPSPNCCARTAWWWRSAGRVSHSPPCKDATWAGDKRKSQYHE